LSVTGIESVPAAPALRSMLPMYVPAVSPVVFTPAVTFTDEFAWIGVADGLTESQLGEVPVLAEAVTFIIEDVRFVSCTIWLNVPAPKVTFNTSGFGLADNDELPPDADSIKLTGTVKVAPFDPVISIVPE
jgi:hypothetical protein